MKRTEVKQNSIIVHTGQSSQVGPLKKVLSTSHWHSLQTQLPILLQILYIPDHIAWSTQRCNDSQLYFHTRLYGRRNRPHCGFCTRARPSVCLSVSPARAPISKLKRRRKKTTKIMWAFPRARVTGVPMCSLDGQRDSRIIRRHRADIVCYLSIG